MKISKQNRKRHNAALELLAKEKLDWDEQQFFFDIIVFIYDII